jgi:uncharacterized protein YjbI with pentapeptide repeats
LAALLISTHTLETIRSTILTRLVLIAVDDISNFIAGAGDSLTFGGTAIVRRLMNDGIDPANECSGWYLQRLSSYLEFHNVHLEGMEFSGSRLEHLRFFNSRIVDCKFDDADCRSWRLKGTDVNRGSFVRSNLRDAVLGVWYEGKCGCYESVNFSSGDMRGIIFSTATYVDCDFSYARLDKVDFQSSSFIRCRFAGELREVIFYDKTFDSKKLEPNNMEDVDFSKAQLRWVAFRRLNMDHVRWPEDTNHIFLKNYRCVLQHVLTAVQNDESRPGRGLPRVLANYLKWAGPNQNIGILNRLDFREAWDEEGENWAVALLHRAEKECAHVQ